MASSKIPYTMSLFFNFSTTLFLIICANLALAQNCYYPNGDLATAGDAPCSSGSNSNCCPYQWECQSNGLCYLENADIYGRYTCTDESWQSGECTQLCTGNGTATGNEAVNQCSDGSWCCSGDRSFDCCETEDMDFFDLPQGTSIAYISEAATPSTPSSISSVRQTGTRAVNSGGESAAPTSQSDTQSTPASSTSSQSSESSATSESSSEDTSATRTPVTIASASINSAGEASTVFVTRMPDNTNSPATSNEQNQDDNDDNNNNNGNDSSSPLPLILGLAIGIPLVILLAAIVLLLLYRRKRRNQTANPFPSTQEPYTDNTSNNPEMRYAVGHFAPSGRAPELDSSPVAPTRSKSGRKSELMGSTHMPSPALSQNSHGSENGLPAYSPGMGGYSPAVGTVQEEERHELWGGYVPYRPPMGSEMGTGRE